ncbi:Gliding motility lipoprotein GldD [Flavobacterium sp. 9AF]|uniref:gliding motility lipoprotein GldD n=1 Tax=Flavobacterium sp. 9AF TaxID=2653142 RepID=UPI0012F3DA3F|nr:gliding motility lipoprotein GldD [Flavobacterium sp. 9AF]VXB41073.1 Gliding motility lipoprotein GldD [Flavobacterium sp. 9AF]
MKKNIYLLLFSMIFISCGEDTIPKPKGQLRLDYPEATYGVLSGSCPFTFDINDNVKVKSNENCSFELHYPKMKATIYLTYKPVENNIDDLLKDAQKLTYDHVIKADDILEQPYINKQKKVYGMFYEVGGNAATNAQFYVTDSTKNFIVGSLYFYAKPNFDSILPAADYVKNDIQNIIETINWK